MRFVVETRRCPALPEPPAGDESNRRGWREAPRARELGGNHAATIAAEIGTGLGFQTAILSVLSREVVSIEKIGALPVVDADGELSGIVSYVDALRALAP